MIWQNKNKTKVITDNENEVIYYISQTGIDEKTVKVGIKPFSETFLTVI